MLEVIAHDPPEQRENRNVVYGGRQSLAPRKRKAPREAGQGLAQEEHSCCLTNSHCSVLPDFRATVSRLHFWPSVALVAELAALIAALRALVEAEASQDRGHTADRKRGGYSRPHDIL